MRLLAFDYTGLASLIVAVGTAVAAIIAALYSRSTHGQVSTNGDPRTIGEQMSDVAAKIAPSDQTTHEPPAA